MDDRFDFQEATIADLGRRLRNGELSVPALAEAYLGRIEAIDRRGPELRSVIQVDPDVAANADRLEGELRDRLDRGPLHGIPILVKDNIATADRMETTAGSLALVGRRPPADAALVARLRDAGALLLGKSNLSEWANFRSTRSSSGWSARGGQCRNPYATDRSPAGSSSGSGVAVAADLCAAAIGTETDGSIVSPSSASGIVGIKPTVGLVSTAGVIPISHTQDAPGPMARTVADAATVLAAMTGDARLAGDPDRGALRGARIGVARNVDRFHPRVDALFEEVLDVLRAAGAELIDPADVPHIDEYEDHEWEVLKYEFKTDIETYLASVPGDGPRTLADLIAFNDVNRDDEMPFFDQDLFDMSVEKGPLTEPAYLEALAACRRLSRDEGLDAVIAEHGLDALVAPTRGPAGLIDHVNGDRSVGDSSSPAAVSGYASITVPMGAIAGLPVGLSFIGGPRREAAMIGYAAALERETSARIAPRFLASVD